MTNKVNKLGAGRATRVEVAEATEATQSTETRPERIPVSGQRDILTVRGKDPAYVYRWVKDEHENGQRMLKFKDAGYEFVINGDSVSVGQNHVYKSENVGSLIRVPAGQGEFLYLMKQLKEFYEEDQAVKQSEILDTENQIELGSKTQEGQYVSRVSITNPN